MPGIGRDAPLRLLDIGAGYGRLAHRLAESVPATEIMCTDAVPASTFLSEFYLRFRGVDNRATAVPHQDFSPVVAQHGWRLRHSEPIYGASEVAQKYALYPNFRFYWFERD